MREHRTDGHASVSLFLLSVRAIRLTACFVHRAAEDVLAKHLTLCREKTERHTRNKTKDKDDAARCKEEAKRAIEEDKARRREAEERKKAAKAAAS